MFVLLASSVNLTKSANILLMLDVCLCFQCFPRPVFILILVHDFDGFSPTERLQPTVVWLQDWLAKCCTTVINFLVSIMRKSDLAMPIRFATSWPGCFGSCPSHHLRSMAFAPLRSCRRLCWLWQSTSLRVRVSGQYYNYVGWVGTYVRMQLMQEVVQWE